ncbi:Major facilitator superfamily [Cynara cardunculus var. scolymus]|uniref:Major facilitator superfamily n=1 Tax=Cynara cardunculus var. scolymus TaxID=59895 RepID=A0A103XED6_CYNCS|nr:Major facilitator superfamily [Cynara cardunculus var. scolymus]
MAIGAVISHRNLPSFIGSGKIYPPEQATAYLRADNLSFSSAQYVHRNMYSEKLYSLKKIYFVSGYWNTISSHGLDPFTGNALRSRTVLSSDRVHPYTVPQESKKFQMTNHRRRARGICRCFVSLPSESCNWIKPVQLQNISICNRKPLQPRHTTINRTRADYKSEEYDVTGTDLDSFVASEAGASEAALVGGMQETKPWWEQFAKRFVIVLLCFSAFLLCNMDRVNMSIAILPMSKEFNWNSATVGLIQSSFFWGYLLTQIVGGIWADKIGGKQVLGFGVIWWSVATVLTPIAAKIGLPFLLVMRAFMGIGEGVAMPAMNNILSKWIPVSERSRSLALVYSGMYLGSVIGLGVSPILIQKLGWPSVFYSFGSLGSVWFAFWLSKVLKFNLTESGLLCVLPWLTMAVFANIGGWIADTLVSRGLSITTVRKIMQSIGFLGPAFFLTQLSRVKTPAMAVLCMACSQGSDAFSQSGLYSNHQDIGPRYAGVLLGLSNTAGVLAGVFGTAATGYILQNGSWDDVFKVAVILYLIGTVVWNLFSTGEKILD